MGLIILGILKFVGLGIAAASTIWGLTRRTTYDDAEGRKRLTSAGQISIALTIGGCLVSTASLGFETIANLAKEKRALEAQAKAAIEKALELQAVAKDRVLARERHDREMAQSQLSTEILRRENAEETTVLLRESELARLRDAALAGSVNYQSERNLSRTGIALTQLERLMQPIGTIQISVDWELRPDTPLAIEALDRIRRLAALVRAGDPQGLAAVGMAGASPAIAATWPNFTLTSDSPYYPTRARDPLLAGAMRAPAVRLSFFAENKAAAGLAATMRAPVSAMGPLYWNGDLRYVTAPNNDPLLAYDFATGALSYNMQIAGLPISSGTILSIPDLERATLGIDTLAGAQPRVGAAERSRLLRMEFRPRRVTIRTAHRTFVIDGARFRTMIAQNAYRLYVTGPLGPPTEPGTPNP